MEINPENDVVIDEWSQSLDALIGETEGHNLQVTEMTVRLAEEMGVSQDEQIQIRRGALLHDIGKLSIPDQILFKPGPLSDEEMVIMRNHPEYALEFLSRFASLQPDLDIPYCHHERWDGSGYPRGLKGEEIPLSARIFTIVDVWYELIIPHANHPTWPEDLVRYYLRRQAGKRFDPDVVKAFFRIYKRNN